MIGYLVMKKDTQIWRSGFHGCQRLLFAYMGNRRLLRIEMKMYNMKRNTVFGTSARCNIVMCILQCLGAVDRFILG